MRCPAPGALLGAVVLALMSVATWASVEGAPAATPTSTADHSRFEILKGPFATGPDVTKACLTCHNKAGKQVMNSIHWTWDFTNEKTGERLGKQRVLNNFCGALPSNEPRCTSCHAGYGWKDQGFDFTNEANVDCLVCHDTTGTYKKLPAGAGHPAYKPIEMPPGSGKFVQPPDLARIAQGVSRSSRDTCGACHFMGGGGDGVKHGDLDSSMAKPSRELDVHMAPDGANLACSSCHTFNAHVQAGSRYVTLAKDTHGRDLPIDDRNRATCESCHGDRPHAAKGKTKLDDHTDRVACQTCHIPAFARGGVATKMVWDWSSAGQLDDKGKPIARKDEHGHVVYASEKGDFVYAENVKPAYRWFNGTIRQTTIGERIDDGGVVTLNPLEGSANDPNARIWPFKAMTGKQPYDPETKLLLVNHTFGNDDSAFWKHFDYQKALKAGMDRVGLPFSGKFDFVATEMYWPITHMVAPKEKALACGECHARDGRLAGLDGFYMPGRDRSALLDLLGFGLVGLVGAGVLGHAALRVLLNGRKPR